MPYINTLLFQQLLTAWTTGNCTEQPQDPSPLLLHSWGLREQAVREPARLRATVPAKSPITQDKQLSQTFNRVGPNHSVGTLAASSHEIRTATSEVADVVSGFQLYPKRSKI